MTPPRALSSFDSSMLQSGRTYIRLRQGFTAALRLLATTVLTEDRLITKRQLAERRRLLQEATRLTTRGILR